jgi:hypothetical protein
MAKRTRTLACVEHDVQQVLSKVDTLRSTVDSLAEEVPLLQQQLSQLVQQHNANGALPSWQGNMLAATQQVEDLSTAIASLKQQFTEARNTFNTGLAGIQEQQQQLVRQQQEQQEQQQLLRQQLQEQQEQQQRMLQKQQEQQQLLTQLREQLQQQSEQQRQQQQQHQPQPTQFMAHAPVGMGGADLVTILAACGGVNPGSITTARIVWSPRGAAAEGSDNVTASGGSSGGGSSGGGSSSRSASGVQRSMCLWEVTLKEGDLLNNMLGGRIRNNLRQAGHSIYVDAVLSAEERQQRKAMQQLRRELQQQGVRTRWSKATLMRWRSSGADGRGSWEEVPPLPAEVPGSAAA